MIKVTVSYVTPMLQMGVNFTPQAESRLRQTKFDQFPTFAPQLLSAQLVILDAQIPSQARCFLLLQNKIPKP